MGAAVINRAKLTTGGSIVFEKLAVGGIEGFGEDFGFGVVLREREVLEGCGEREELTK